MKRLRLLYTLAFACLLISCKEKVEPEEKGLEGTWLLVENSFWDGQIMVKESIAPSPPRTVTFTSSGQFYTTALPDTALNQFHYYKAGYSELIGPVINLGKTVTALPNTMKYLVDRDTLQLSPLGRATINYRFRRL